MKTTIPTEYIILTLKQDSIYIQNLPEAQEGSRARFVDWARFFIIPVFRLLPGCPKHWKVKFNLPLNCLFKNGLSKPNPLLLLIHVLT